MHEASQLSSQENGVSGKPAAVSGKPAAVFRLTGDGSADHFHDGKQENSDAGKTMLLVRLPSRLTAVSFRARKKVAGFENDHRNCLHYHSASPKKLIKACKYR